MSSVFIVMSLIAVTAGLCTFAAYRSAKRRTRNYSHAQEQANRAADAAARVGGYDELYEIERERRRSRRRHTRR